MGRLKANGSTVLPTAGTVGQRDREGLEGRPYGVFCSHGGGGDVRGPLEKLFKHLGGDQVGQTIESRGRPNATVLRACTKLGVQLAQAGRR
jgi:flavorubredoxin